MTKTVICVYSTQLGADCLLVLQGDGMVALKGKQKAEGRIGGLCLGGHMDMGDLSQDCSPPGQLGCSGRLTPQISLPGRRHDSTACGPPLDAVARAKLPSEWNGSLLWGS